MLPHYQNLVIYSEMDWMTHCARLTGEWKLEGIYFGELEHK